MEYGLIGKSLPHSYSKIIHNKIGDYDYRLNPLSEEELDAFMKSKDFKGINVTIPYKKTVIPYLDEISEKAKAIGSVNTVVNRGGKLYGYNTDYAGFVLLAERAGIDFKGTKTVVLGSGGTSLTACSVARDKGAKSVIVISRNGENNYENISRHYDADILINTTPVGMYPENENSPVSLDGFTKLKGVIDVIYNPLNTRFLLDAKSRGISCTGGLPMLVAQAVYAYSLFFDKGYDVSVTEKVLTEMINETENLVFVGMPGCGKSTIGKLVAEKLGRDFVDTDEYIKKQQNTTIPDIFEKYGEAGFRMMERDTSAIVGKAKNTVISCGGGIVLFDENYLNLKQNGRIVFIERNLSGLSTDGRPLSKSYEALKEIYEKRIGLYKKWADFTVLNDSTPEAAVDEILQNCYKY